MQSTDSTSDGFSLIEVALVVMILSVILLMTISISMNSIARGNVQSAQLMTVQSLRRAQTIAQNNVAGSAAGVYLCDDPTIQTECGTAPVSIIIFKRSTFTTFDPNTDDVFELSEQVTIAGDLFTTSTASDEGIIFAQLSGIPNYNGEITLSANDETKTITVNTKGTIEY